MQKKRRHHYVWQRYLEAWVVNEYIWCKRKTSPAFRTSILNVGLKKDFYRLRRMSPADIAFVEKAWIGALSPEIQPALRVFVPFFKTVFELKDVIGSSSPEADKLLDAAINNLEEDLHSSIEGAAVHYMKALRRGNCDFLSHDGDCFAFLHYLCVQYTRTPRMKENIRLGVQRIPGVDFENIWGIMRHLVATQLAYGMFVSRDELVATLLTSPAGEFVTGDQPVINLHAVGAPLGEEVKRLRFYYPVSPHRALLLDMQSPGHGRIESTDAAVEQVMDLNTLFVAYGHSQLYASRKESLSRIL